LRKTFCYGYPDSIDSAARITYTTPIFRILTQPICAFFKKRGKKPGFSEKTWFLTDPDSELPKLGLEEQSAKPQIKLSRGAENRLRQGQPL